VPFRIPSARINWVNSSFIVSTSVITLIGVPWYLWNYGIDLFQAGLFLAFFVATGLSITLGYHRLFSHAAFQASWPVRALTLAFGAATFQNHVLAWVSDHRRHHKHVDHDDDPYDISKGFWHAHIGWILFRLDPEPPWDNVADLRKDWLVMAQFRFYIPIAILVSFVLPAYLGWLHAGTAGALGGFMLAGVARLTAVHHMTFFINSLCHTIGSRPYSDRCSARDSGIMAIFTFGEGYHNYHHEFQHDYRNGVRWWQWDPTKWTIWTLEKVRLVRGLRRAPEEKVLLSQLQEARRRLDARLSCPESELSARLRELLRSSDTRLHELGERWGALKVAYSEKADARWEEARQALVEIRREVYHAFELLELAGAPV
jgi:stearoyl-CoA desaturase (delta-9 desaturase)